MRRAAAFAALAACALACASLGVPSVPGASPGVPDLPVTNQAAARLVFVTIHGLTPDHYLATAPAMPLLAALANHGAAAEGVAPVLPATVYAAHATLVTGVEPARHGVTSDHRLDPGGVSPRLLDQTEDVHGASLLAAARSRGARVAALDWPSTGGARVDDLAPDLSLEAGASWVEALARKGAGRVGELAARVGAKDAETHAPGAARDAALVTMACALLVGDPAPSLLLLRLSGTAAVLAENPAGSPAAQAAFTAADAELGRLARCLGDAGLLESTAIAVAGDFGLAPVHTELRPNAVLAEAGLLVPSADATQSWDAIARSNGSSAFVYAADDDAALLARRAMDLFATQTGALRVVSAKEMVARGADPEAWFGLETEPGFVFGDGTGGSPMRAAPVASASVSGAGHEARAATGFVAWGAGLRSGIRIPGMRQIDVAPTLAYWMSLPLGEVQGRALVGLFRAGGP